MTPTTPLRFAAAFFASTFFNASLPAQSPAFPATSPAPASADEALVLSPFQVDATADKGFPLVTVDTRDGQHTPSVAIYNLKEPRTFQFTSTFKF